MLETCKKNSEHKNHPTPHSIVESLLTSCNRGRCIQFWQCFLSKSYFELLSLSLECRHNVIHNRFKPNTETWNGPTYISYMDFLIVTGILLSDYIRGVFKGSVPLIIQSLHICVPKGLWELFIRENCYELGKTCLAITTNKDDSKGK